MADTAIRSVDSVQGLHDRITSAFPVSIGTALALETLFDPWEAVYDPNREIEEKLDATLYGSVYLNLDTLIRNLFGSIPKTLLIQSSGKELAEVIAQEIDIITQLFADMNPHLTVTVYQMEYKRLEKAAKRGAVNLRAPFTEASMLNFSKAQETRLALSEYRAPITSVKDTIVSGYQAHDALIFTHMAYDMLGYGRFKSLTLVQSHTGKVIRRKDYATLYYPISKEKLQDLPFFEELLYILGDRNQIHPYTPATRRAIIDVALKRNWTSYTTPDKVKLDLSIDLDPNIRSKLPL